MELLYIPARCSILGSTPTWSSTGTKSSFRNGGGYWQEDRVPILRMHQSKRICDGAIPLFTKMVVLVSLEYINSYLITAKHFDD
jgi:hypothetical protein